MVFGRSGAGILSFSPGDRESGRKPISTVNMKRRWIVFGLVAIVIAVALLLVWYLYLGSSAPAGQQQLVRLDSSNIESLKQSFNDSKDSVRVMVMLSPT